MKYIKRTNKNINSNFLEELLYDRKIITDENKEQFFYPSFENEEDPLLLDNMELGVKLLLSHLNKGNEIYLIVDADCDGYTSSALFYNYIMGIASTVGWEPNIIYHIPEGKEHGLSTIMDWFPENGTDKLIVCPDSSSNDYEEHQKLKQQGYDILVLDHHEASHYSEAAVVINNQLSKDYPNKCLSGVGVVYKFFEFFESNIDIPKDISIKNYLDLVALGEVSDVMLMTTLENRFICDYGLTHIKNKFFQELVHKQCFSLFGIGEDQWSNNYYTNGELTQIKVAFYITPLINALIRVGNMTEKTTLFEAFIRPNEMVPSTKRGEKGQEETICTQAIRNCVNAKSRQTRERDKAAELLDIQISNNCLDDNKILILDAGELNVPNTMTGLCAMGVASKYKKPVLLGRISPDGKEMKGSIRSFDNSPLPNLKDFLNASGLMSYVEGHQGAAGWGAPTANLDKLVEYANRELKDINFNEGYYEADFILKKCNNIYH